MGFDITMVVVSAAACLIMIHSLGSVGAGTVIAAFLVGFILGIINKSFGKYRDKLLKKTRPFRLMKKLMMSRILHM